MGIGVGDDGIDVTAGRTEVVGGINAVGVAAEVDGISHAVTNRKIQNVRRRRANRVRQRIQRIVRGLVIFTKILHLQNSLYTTNLYIL